MTDESNAYPGIPRLMGSENLLEWLRAITSYLRRKDAHRTFLGHDPEPFRTAVHVDDENYRQIRPRGEVAGDCAPNAQQTTSCAALTADQLTTWLAWASRESRARAAIQETVTAGLAMDLDGCWSANDMRLFILNEMDDKNDEHRGYVEFQLNSLRLPEDPTVEQMEQHLEQFRKLLAQAQRLGMDYDDWNRSQKFLFSLGDSIASNIRMEYRLTPNRTFQHLIVIFKDYVNGRRIQALQTSAVNAVTGRAIHIACHEISAPNGNGQSTRGPNQMQQQGSATPRKRCSWCQIPGHVESECRKKKAGEPRKDKKARDNGKPERANKPKGNAKPRTRQRTGAHAVTDWPFDEDETHSDSDSSIVAALLEPIEDDAPTDPDTPVIVGHIAPALAPTIRHRKFIADSGSGKHLVPCQDMLHNYRPINTVSFGQAGDGSLSAIGIGDLRIDFGKGVTITIQNVHLAPRAKVNILSLKSLEREGWIFDTTHDHVTVPALRKNAATPLRLKLSTAGDITCVNLPIVHATTSIVAAISPLHAEHIRLGHPSKSALLALAKSGKLRLSHQAAKRDSFSPGDCTSCGLAHPKKLPRSGSSPRGNAAGEMIHADLTGKMHTSASGNNYGLVLVADHAAYRQFIPLRSKNAIEVGPHIANFIAKIETQTGQTVRVLRTDGGGEFLNATLRSHLNTKGIIHQRTPASTPELNGVAERNVGIIKAKGNAMHANTTLFPHYWDFAYRYAAHLLNKTTLCGWSTDAKPITAWQAVTHREPHLDAVLAFGQPVYAAVPHLDRHKYPLNGRLARVLTQEENVSGFYVRYDDTGLVGLAKDIRLAASLTPSTPLTGKDASAPALTPGPTFRPGPVLRRSTAPSAARAPRVPIGSREPSIAPNIVPQDRRSTAPTPAPQILADQGGSNAAPVDTSASAPAQTNIAPEGGLAQTPTVGQPSSTLAESSDLSPTKPPPPPPSREASHKSEAPPVPSYADIASKLKNVKKNLPPTEGTRRSARLPSNEPTTSRRVTFLDSMFVAALYDAPDHDDPRTVKQALAGPDAEHWRTAIAAELASLTRKGTFSESRLPPKANLVGSKWVLKTKRNADNVVVKYKARCVAQGFSQQPGRDYEETYAPVSRAASLRLLLTISAAKNLHLEQADVDSAYLNGSLDEPVYLKFPETYRPKDKTSNCWRLHKALYGLKQSGHQWWRELTRVLKLLGFTRLQSDWGMYTHTPTGRSSPTAILLVYVDDLLLASPSATYANSFFTALSKHWPITRLGIPTQLLGISILPMAKPSTHYCLHQQQYITMLATRFPAYRTTIAKLAPLPVSHDIGDASPLTNIREYQELVGCLQWIAGITRPDIAYTASFLGTYAHAPTVGHLNLAHRVISYLVHTRDLVLVIGGHPSRGLSAYVDADWAGCISTRRSTTGYIIYLCGSPISWTSKRQASVASSTMEAEYIAAAEAAKDVAHYRAFLAELGLDQRSATPLHVDNEAAIRLASNPAGTHARAKHIELRYHAIRERVHKGELTIVYVRTTQQRADVLTKPLAGPAHANALQFLRLHN